MRRFLWDDVVIPVERAASEIDASEASFEAHGFGLWVLRGAGERGLLGICGLRQFGEPTNVEILYSIVPRVWHRGLATEAAAAVLDYGFWDVGVERIFGRTDPPNVASRHVLERLGFAFLGETRLESMPIVEYRLERGQHKAAR